MEKERANRPGMMNAVPPRGKIRMVVGVEDLSIKRKAPGCA